MRILKVVSAFVLLATLEQPICHGIFLFSPGTFFWKKPRPVVIRRVSPVRQGVANSDAISNIPLPVTPRPVSHKPMTSSLLERTRNSHNPRLRTTNYMRSPDNPRHNGVSGRSRIPLWKVFDTPLQVFPGTMNQGKQSADTFSSVDVPSTGVESYRKLKQEAERKMLLLEEEAKLIESLKKALSSATKIKSKPTRERKMFDPWHGRRRKRSTENVNRKASKDIKLNLNSNLQGGTRLLAKKALLRSNKQFYLGKFASMKKIQGGVKRYIESSEIVDSSEDHFLNQSSNATETLQDTIMKNQTNGAESKIQMKKIKKELLHIAESGRVKSVISQSPKAKPAQSITKRGGPRGNRYNAAMAMNNKQLGMPMAVRMFLRKLFPYPFHENNLDCRYSWRGCRVHYVTAKRTDGEAMNSKDNGHKLDLISASQKDGLDENQKNNDSYTRERMSQMGRHNLKDAPDVLPNASNSVSENKTDSSQVAIPLNHLESMNSLPSDDRIQENGNQNETPFHNSNKQSESRPDDQTQISNTIQERKTHRVFRLFSDKSAENQDRISQPAVTSRSSQAYMNSIGKDAVHVNNDLIEDKERLEKRNNIHLEQSQIIPRGLADGNDIMDKHIIAGLSLPTINESREVNNGSQNKNKSTTKEKSLKIDNSPLKETYDDLAEDLDRLSNSTAVGQLEEVDVADVEKSTRNESSQVPTNKNVGVTSTSVKPVVYDNGDDVVKRRNLSKRQRVSWLSKHLRHLRFLKSNKQSSNKWRSFRHNDKGVLGHFLHLDSKLVMKKRDLEMTNNDYLSNGSLDRPDQLRSGKNYSQFYPYETKEEITRLNSTNENKITLHIDNMANSDRNELKVSTNFLASKKSKTKAKDSHIRKARSAATQPFETLKDKDLSIRPKLIKLLHLITKPSFIITLDGKDKNNNGGTMNGLPRQRMDNMPIDEERLSDQASIPKRRSELLNSTSVGLGADNGASNLLSEERTRTIAKVLALLTDIKLMNESGMRLSSHENKNYLLTNELTDILSYEDDVIPGNDRINHNFIPSLPITRNSLYYNSNFRQQTERYVYKNPILTQRDMLDLNNAGNNEVRSDDFQEFNDANSLANRYNYESPLPNPQLMREKPRDILGMDDEDVTFMLPTSDDKHSKSYESTKRWLSAFSIFKPVGFSQFEE